jgi:hypothetical protein
VDGSIFAFAFSLFAAEYRLILRQEERVPSTSREKLHTRIGLTQVELETQWEAGKGVADSTGRRLSSKGAIGVIVQAGDRKEEKGDRD